MGLRTGIQQPIKSSVKFYEWIVTVILMGLNLLTSKQFLSQGKGYCMKKKIFKMDNIIKGSKPTQNCIEYTDFP